MLGKGTFGKVVECTDLKRLVDKINTILFLPQKEKCRELIDVFGV